jgi:hypothetical protein
MSNPVWSWFKKAAHYVKVGVVDANKFLQTSGALNLLSLLPAGGALQIGVGVFEKALAAASKAEQAAAVFAPNVAGTGPQKLLLSTPEVEQALYQLLSAAGLKNTNQQKVNTIAAAIVGAAADLWNVVEPVNGQSLPQPTIDVQPVSVTVGPPTTPKS